MSNTEFKTRINAKPYKPEILPQESLTEPDESMSIRGLITRLATNGTLNAKGPKNPVYNEQWEYPDIEKIDLVDRQRISEELSEKINNTKSRGEKLNNAKEKIERNISIHETAQKIADSKVPKASE